MELGEPFGHEFPVSGFNFGAPLFLQRAWRKLLKQFLDAFIQVLDVLVGVARDRVTGAASPYQLLRLRVEQIDHQRPYLVCIGCCRCLAKATASKTSPTPASSKPVVEGIEILLIVGHLNGDDRNIAAR